MYTFVVIALLVSVEIPENIKTYLERAEEHRPAAVKKLEGELQKTKRQLRSGVRGGTSAQRRIRAKELRAEIKDLEKLLRKAKIGPPPVPLIDPFQLSLGQIGRFSEGVEILQVVDETTMLVVPVKIVTQIYFVGLIAKQSFSEEQGEPIMVRGRSTKGFTDQKRTKLPDAFEVVGTEGYRTVMGGGKTVFTVRLFDLKKIEPFLAAGSTKPNYRTWTDSGSKFTVEAEFVKFEDNKVFLKKRDGTVIDLPSRRLSDSDQRWIRKHLSKR